MSTYNYAANASQTGQYNQYNYHGQGGQPAASQQYTQQGFQQLGPIRPGQYSSAQHAYPNIPILPQQHPVQGTADINAAATGPIPLSGYPDYKSAYTLPSHNLAYAAPQQQHRFPPQHIPNGSHLAYQQASQSVLPQQPQLPVPTNLASVPKPAPKSHVAQKIQTPAKVVAPPPAKRARSSNKRVSSKKVEESEPEQGSEDDDYNMDGMKTKSGRKVHKPSQFTPATKTPSRRRGAPSKKVILDSLFCKVCERGHSPRSNLIVFCDGCNLPYHQLCHVPVIDNLLITLPDAEWFCTACDEKRAQRKLRTGHDGSDLSEEQKKTYMTSLPTAHLVELVMYAVTQHPELKLFSPDAAKQLEMVHDKHVAAILEDQARLAASIYQAVPGDELVASIPGDNVLQQRIVDAVKASKRLLNNRDIMEYIESHHIVDPSSFRVRCAEEISRLVDCGILDKDGTLLTLGHVSTAVKEKPASSPDPTGASAQGPADEQYPKVEGIRLPAESESNDGFAMQETVSPAFNHVENFHSVRPRVGCQTQVIEH